jgi:molybdenum cofactor cytidylyltransferase
MRFGPLPLDEAIGAMAAHSVRAPGVAVKKGATVTAEDAAKLREAGIDEIVAVVLEEGDVAEDEAAHRLARATAGEGVRVEEPFTGRCNLFGECAGVLLVDKGAIDRINLIDEAITFATLAQFKPVVPGEMVATVKIITYGVAQARLDQAAEVARGGRGAVRVAPYRLEQLGVISTLTPSFKPSIVDKTLRILGERLEPTGAAVVAEARTAHETQALAEALRDMAAGDSEIIVVFGASAVSDRRDVIPAAITQIGGRIEHFGMPVDPGNLLLIGSIAGKPVIGAPGCARSPKENGFDWVLHRMLAGLPVTRADIMGMGVGGLLMEIVSRPQPRTGEASADEDGAEEDA